jgi:twitching motility protein PilT
MSAPNQLGHIQQSFNQVLQMMLSVSDKVSDLIFSPGRPPQVELVGQLRAVKIQGLEQLTPQHTHAFAQVLLANNPANLEKLEKFGSVDLSYSVPGHSRFRSAPSPARCRF